MIDNEAIAEILSLYKKHGWTLRRVLLSQDPKNTNYVDLFGEIEPERAAIDALWFSRSSKPGSETWELRHLGQTPFALLEVIETDLDESARDQILAATEEKIARLTLKLGASNN